MKIRSLILPTIVLAVVSRILGLIFTFYVQQPGQSRNSDILARQPSTSKFADLTILVDWTECQEPCMFVHPILPPWVRFRYHNLNLTDVNNDRVPRSSHYMFIARRNILDLAGWAQRHRVEHSFSVGLWLMADEFDKFDSHNDFASFDYVIRHYFFQTKLDHFYVRALGNQTCGSSPPLPTSHIGEPRWGVHWGFLAPHKPHALLFRPASSIVPASQRGRTCGFIGRSTQQRETMKQQLALAAPEVKCQIHFSQGFSLGSEKLKYLANDLQDIKIGLNPSGNNAECHRLPELLTLGTVPAMLDAQFLTATFRPVPGIIGKNWGEVGTQIVSLSSANRSKELDDLSQAAANFYEELLSCMMSDMDVILRGAFNDTNNSSRYSNSNYSIATPYYWQLLLLLLEHCLCPLGAIRSVSTY